MQATWLMKKSSAARKPDADDKRVSFADQYDVRMMIAKNVTDDVDALVSDLASDITKIVLRYIEHMPTGGK